MVQILFLALFGIGLFATLTLLRKWADSFMMIAFAIGCVCCSNIYNAVNSGIEVNGIIFAVDSILYTMFLYTVTVKFIHYDKKESRLFIYSSIVAIIISAFIEFFNNTITKGYDVIYLKSLFAYFISAFGTLIACLVLRFIGTKLLNKGVNRRLVLPICILVGSIINSTIYYPLTYLVYGSSYFTNILGVLLGSYIGKIFATLLGEISYFLNDDDRWSVNELVLRDK